MKAKQFDKLAKEAFGSVLHDFGFTSEGSRWCTFHRQVNEDIYHFILPDLSSRGVWYDVKVFATCPRLDPLFSEKFPDSLGIPTDYCYLAPSGIGLDQTSFNTKSEENFRNRFKIQVASLLTNVAIPYLDRIQSLEDLLPLIQSPHYIAIASFYLYGDEKSRELLRQQHKRFLSYETDDKAIVSILTLIEGLLATPS
ncbi:hypothetical protein [Bremerella sp.]|uniref:hypothetical protein n=1 Tax=Bremerella sp. TaxID=2795602 RepID=UPI00391B2C42